MCPLRLCLAVIIALPIATPKELKNKVSYALGNFTNRTRLSLFSGLLFPFIGGWGFAVVYDWPNGFAFILSFLAPVWTICAHFVGSGDNNCLQKVIHVIGSFDSPVHISEEASNAATAVPWAIIWATSTAGILGIGTVFIILVNLVSYLF